MYLYWRIRQDLEGADQNICFLMQAVSPEIFNY